MSIQTDTLSKNIKVPFLEGEEDRFKTFLRSSGRKAGPYLRVLILREIERAERIAAGRTQIDMEELEARR